MRILHVISAVLSFLAVLIGLCMFVLPFLTVDRNFHITPVLSIQNFINAWDPLMVEAIQNSVVLSVLASLFAIGCGAILTRLLARWPLVVGVGIVLVYSINPVIRALSFAELFTIDTPLQQWAIALIGEWGAQMILLPALILGAHYLPIYLMRFLFVIRKPVVAHELSGWLDAFFVSIPAFLRGFPISFAIFFLLTFFDYWVIQTIGGGKALYWSQMFEQKAFVVRDVGQASMLIILGLVMTVIVYVLALAICNMLRLLMRRLRPLTIATIRSVRIPYLPTILSVSVLLCLAWPVFYTVIRLFEILMHHGEFRLMDGAWRAIGLTVILTGSIALCSTLLSFVLSAFFREHQEKCQWWLPALYFLALVPEAAYVLFSLCVTGLGILKAGPLWLFVLMTSFSAPMSFFMWESLWGEGEERKLWMLVSAMRGKFIETLGLAVREWKRFFALTFIINLWMTIDNVFITNFSAGPKWKPISAVVFSATKRGFQDDKFLTGTMGSVVMLSLIGLILLAVRFSVPKNRA